MPELLFTSVEFQAGLREPLSMESLKTKTEEVRAKPKTENGMQRKRRPPTKVTESSAFLFGLHIPRQVLKLSPPLVVYYLYR